MAEAASAPPHAPRMFQLDGYRGVAAFMIVFYHLTIVYGFDGPFSRGYLFVDLFFLLSGFVLAVSTERKLLSGIGAAEFTWARFKRLWPLVAVGASVAVVRAFVIGMADPLTLLWWLALDLLMIPSLAGTGPFYRFNGPQWTLFYELLANFVHALALKHIPTKAMLLLAIVMGAWLVHAASLHGSDTMGVDAPTWQTWWMALPRVGFSYVLGVWIGRKYREGFRTGSAPWWIAMALPIAGIMIVPYLPLGKVTGDLLFVFAVLPPTLWLIAMAQPPQKLRAPMEWFGNYSLPLYCVHLTVLVWMKEIFGPSGATAIAAVLTAMFLAWAFSRLISFASKPTPHKGTPIPKENRASHQG